MYCVCVHIYIYTHGIFIQPSKKKKEILTHGTTWINLEDTAKWNKLITKWQVFYDSTYMRYVDLSKSETEGRTVVGVGADIRSYLIVIEF